MRDVKNGILSYFGTKSRFGIRRTSPYVARGQTMTDLSPDSRLQARILALFFFPGGILSRRGLSQMLDCTSPELDRQIAPLCSRGILGCKDADHWYVRDGEQLARHVAGDG